MMTKIRRKSPLTTIECLSPNCNKPRISLVRGSTPHHMVGNLSIETCMNMTNVATYTPKGGMSMNYAIGSDGRIGLCVEETNRAWTSSSPTNDHRCITTEIANNGGAPDWRISDKAINAWLDLTVEQCQFYGFKKVNYQPKPNNITIAKVENWISTWAKDDEWIITLHNWFNPTECPGQYLTRQLPWLVKEMNKRLNGPQYKAEMFIGEGVWVPVGPVGVDNPNLSSSGPKSIDEIAKEVIKGDWGNGQERIDRLTSAGYNASIVQTRVNEFKSTAMSIDQAKPVTPVEFKEYQVIITASALNIRKEASVNSERIMTLVNDKNIYTIIEEKSGPSGNGTDGMWGKLKSGIGWILLFYTQKR